MRSSRNGTKWAAGAVAVVLAALAIASELPPVAADIVAKSALETALFRLMGVPGGVVTHLRPPWEARSHLTSLLQQSPHQAGLYSIRAREEERLQDYTAAEADWTLAADNATDRIAGLTELAEYYQRRVQPEQQLNTLLRLGALPPQASERFQPDEQQPQWAAFAQALNVANDALLPAVRYQSIFNAWINRYPNEAQPYQSYLAWCVQRNDRAGAAAVAARIKKTFPNDIVLDVSTDASLARVENGPEAALAVYSRDFSPLWPQPLKAQYWQALGEAHQLRTFLANAQAAAASHPTDLEPAVRLYFYYEQENRKEAADQQLLLLMSRRAAQNTSWTPGELETLAALFRNVQDYDESAHAAYLIYEMPSAAARAKESALAGIISLLLEVPEKPLQFENRDLSLYKNIGRMDRHPGFLNGILSLALNTTYPEYQYQAASQAAVSYFHRASASALIDLLRRQFPNSPHLADLEAELYRAYEVYGQDDAIIRSVPAWLNRNRNSPEYVDIALVLADAYMVKQDTASELAIYDRLLAELGEKSQHMPIGAQGVTNEAQGPRQTAGAIAVSGARVPDYARVLDRYISRLVQIGRSMDAVRLFRREIDRNPDDPGIYERLALFFEQNQLDSDVEQTYREAFSHFKDMSWASKLARFYLRQKQDTAYEQLSHQITDTFKGSEVARFLDSVPPSSAVLYRQVNLYAHQRFPQNLVFVRNLINAYRRRETRDNAARAALLREYWYYDATFRTEFFEDLSASGQLKNELAALPSVERASRESNLAALEFRAEGQAWLTHYETAAPAFARLATLALGNESYTERAISIERSLAPEIPGSFDSAIRFAQQQVKSMPGNLAALTRVGEIYADRDQYAQARPWWNRVATVEPGSSEGYLESATVFWDYFQFPDALRIISDARRTLKKPALFSYEAGAIYENEGKYREAIAAYTEGALHGGSEQARERLITLAARKATAPLVEQATATLTATGFDSNAFELRLRILEKLNRRQDIGGFLSAMLPRVTAPAEITEIRSTAERLGFDNIAAQALERTVAITSDPVEKMQARIELARFYESHNDMARAQSEFSSLLNDHPNILGVIRAAVDFDWRAKQGQAAVQTLEAAANRAQQPYQTQLRREAAQKATDSGLFQEARNLLDQLLADDPYNGDLLAAKAATYARAGDSTGLVAFYAAELKTIQAAPLPPQDKTTRLAALRRGYIQALISTNQFRDALEQYEQVLNAYPEDAPLATEVSRFAANHQLAAPLIAYYEKATSDSPRDYRWPLILARIDTALRRYPEAVTAYNKAAYVRPDRADIMIAKVDLETRLLRFQDVLASDQKLYELTYHDPQYLAAQAETYARLGNKPEAMRLLRAAYIDAHPHEAFGYVAAMERAQSWNWFHEVDELFNQVRPLLSARSGSFEQALRIESEALVALHRPMDAIQLVAAMAGSPQEAQQFVPAIGMQAHERLTPPEKFAFSQQIDKPGGLPPQIQEMQLAQSAGFGAIEAKLTARNAESSERPEFSWQRLNQFQSNRLLFDQLGHELEAIALRHARLRDHAAILNAAALAYKNAGDTASELRLYWYAGRDFPRLFLAAGGDLPGRLATLTASNPKLAYVVVNYIIANGTPEEAVQAIAACGSHQGALWANSYTGLTGLYFLSPATWARSAFENVLGPRTVGAEITGAGSDALRGADWFYYAARYGDYLGYRKQPGAQNFLPAPVEASPAASNAYVQLADSYREMKDPAHATQRYEDALQLSPERADIYDRLALLAVDARQRNLAIERWRRAFQILTARVEQGPLQPDYWQTAQTVLTHMNQFRLVNALEPDADTMLRAYAKRNGSYNFTPFLQGIFKDTPDPAGAMHWAIELSQLPNMDWLIAGMIDAQWIPQADKRPLYEAKIARDRKALSAAVGKDPIEQATSQLASDLAQYARYLGSEQRWSEEWNILQEIQPPRQRPADQVLEAGAMTGNLDKLLEQYRTRPETAPTSQQVLNIAASLDRLGKKDLALQIEEFEYQRELAEVSPPASAWFGLAKVRFEQKRNDDALALIRDVTLTVGAPFENLPEAVRILEDAGLKEEAARYASEWKTAVPWNTEAQLASARLNSDTSLLNEIRRSPDALYSARVRAARLLRDLNSPAAGTDELALLTHRHISATEALQPFYVEARLDAANESSTAAEKIPLYQEAIALEPALREPRLDLAQAALSSGRDSFGLATFFTYQSSPNGEDEAPRFRSFAPVSYPVTESQKLIEVQQLAAAALVRQHEYTEAVQIYTEAMNAEQDAAKRAEIKKLRDAAEQKQALVMANAARQPLAGDGVTQNRIVKPKLKTLSADWLANTSLEPGEEH